MDVYDLQARFRAQLADLTAPIRDFGGPVKLYLSMCSPEHPPPAEIHGQDLDCLLVMVRDEDARPDGLRRSLRLEVGGLPHVLGMDDAITTLRAWIADSELRVWDYRYQDIGGQLDFTVWVGGRAYPAHLLPAPKPRPAD